MKNQISYSICVFPTFTGFASVCFVLLMLSGCSLRCSTHLSRADELIVTSPTSATLKIEKWNDRSPPTLHFEKLAREIQGIIRNDPRLNNFRLEITIDLAGAHLAGIAGSQAEVDRVMQILQSKGLSIEANYTIIDPNEESSQGS